MTDHAFWIGVYAVDYFLESREMGASLAIYKRNISRDKIIKIDSCPYINKDIYNEPLPFDIEKTKYIFTGGALYKTLGDKNLLYYKIIDILLHDFSDLNFLYAGSGDSSEIKKILKKYPGRAFFISERPDFFRIIENCIFYLNSYPMFGGLMMRYAALAGKIPLTLKHEHDADGILENQDQLGIQFKTVEGVLNEAEKLIVDVQYREKKGLIVKNSVITEEIFARNLKLIIENKRSEYTFGDIKEIDTLEFQKEYVARFKVDDYYKTIASKINKNLLFVLPKEFTKGVFLKLRDRKRVK